jgi:hypothetical protein
MGVCLQCRVLYYFGVRHRKWRRIDADRQNCGRYDPAGSTNLDSTISGDSKYVFTLNSGTGTIGIFVIQSNGALNNVDEIGGLPQSVGMNGIAAL